MKILIDTSWVLHRSFHAYSLSVTHDGVEYPTGHVYGAIRAVKSLMEKYPQADIFLCKDSRPYRKIEAFPDYKADRGDKKFNLHKAYDHVACLLSRKSRCFSTFLDGYEADDVIAFWAKNSKEEVIIFSGDDDLLQVVGGRVRIGRKFEPSGRLVLLTDVYCHLRHGVGPDSLAFYKVIVGESDNIRGIPSFPREMARQIATKYKKPSAIRGCRSELMAEFGTTSARISYLVKLYQRLSFLEQLFDYVVYLPHIVDNMEEPQIRRSDPNGFEDLIVWYNFGEKITSFLRSPV